jgi:hypothetical protein
MLAIKSQFAFANTNYGSASKASAKEGNRSEKMSSLEK